MTILEDNAGGASGPSEVIPTLTFPLLPKKPRALIRNSIGRQTKCPDRML
jgi:hypothetical protein